VLRLVGQTDLKSTSWTNKHDRHEAVISLFDQIPSFDAVAFEPLGLICE
jgi:hypothetical protein